MIDGRSALRLGDAWHIRADATDGRRTGTRNRHRAALEYMTVTTRRAPEASVRRSSTIRASRSPSPTWPPSSTPAPPLTWRASWMAANGVPFRARRGLDVEIVGQRGGSQGPPNAQSRPWAMGLHQPTIRWRNGTETPSCYTIFGGHVQRDSAGGDLDRVGSPPTERRRCTSSSSRLADRGGKYVRSRAPRRSRLSGFMRWR